LRENPFSNIIGKDEINIMIIINKRTKFNIDCWIPAGKKAIHL
jgi:hypothetical protein